MVGRSVGGVKKSWLTAVFLLSQSVQIHVHSPTTAAEYSKNQGHLKSKPPERCLHCAHPTLHRHGWYLRNVVELGRLYEIRVPRFLCPPCHRTISLLPSFAQPYRLLGTVMTEAFLTHRFDAPGTDSYRDLLLAYRRRWEQRAPVIETITGAFFAPVVDESVTAAQRLLKSMLSQWGDLSAASVGLLEDFGEALLGRYRIHDWARVARGSVDPWRKPPIKDSS